MISFSFTLLTQVLIFGFSSYCAYYVYWQLTTGASRRRMIQDNGCKPVMKAPSWDTLFGLDLLIEGVNEIKSHVSLEKSQKRFADFKRNTFRVRVLGQRIFITMEPENVKTILSSKFTSYSIGERRKKALIPFMGEGILTTDGEKWQHSRNMIRPSFTRTQISDLDMYETHVLQLMQNIPRDGTTVDLQGLFFRMTLDVATDFLFGESTNCLTQDEGNTKYVEFVDALAYCNNMLEGGEGVLSLFLPSSRFRRSCKIIHDFVDALIENIINPRSSSDISKSLSSTDRHVFLQELVSQTTDKVKIRAELLNMLLAGRDTTASLLSNVWFQLSKRPDVWARLREEVDGFGGELPTYEQLKNMKYLRAVINESLRLYPIVPDNAREAIVDTVLPIGGGKDGLSPVLVKKGDVVSWSLWNMHRRKDIYGDDAEMFKPDRWLDHGDQKGLRVGWEYVPFNGGPRICIGQQFALMETSYVTVRLAQEFVTLGSRDPNPWIERLGLTATGRGGCKVSLTPRI